MSTETINGIINDLEIKDTQWKNIVSNRTQVVTKTIDMGIWVVGTLIQIFIKSSYTETKFSKKESS